MGLADLPRSADRSIHPPVTSTSRSDRIQRACRRGRGRIWPSNPRQMMREGFVIARYTVERSMREMGLAGVIRGKPLRTTISDKVAPCPRDHVNRQLYAPAPNMLWESDRRMVPVGQHMPASSWMRWSKRFRPQAGPPWRPDSSQRPRVIIRVCRAHRATCRGRARAVGRQRRRQL